MKQPIYSVYLYDRNPPARLAVIDWNLALSDNPPDEYKNYLITFTRGDHTTRVTMDMWCPPTESREGHWFNHGDDVVRWRELPAPYAFSNR